jgi:hypothetical protein
MTDLLTKVGQRLLTFGISGKCVIKFASKLPIAERHTYLVEVLEHFREQLKTGIRWKYPPVDIRTFIESEDLLNKPGVIYPEIMRCMKEANNGTYVETVNTGGIGSGKTTFALYSQAYQVYILSCMFNPQAEFKLDPSSEIMIVFQSINSRLSKTVDYNRFRSMIEGSPYFKNVFPFKKDIEAELIFPNRILVRPLSGDSQAAIGQNVIGGMLDEVNFMQVVEQSKQSNDGGLFDQAKALYNSIVNRRKSRFNRKGHVWGLLNLVSSKRYPGEFTDLKMKESRDQLADTGKTDIYVYDKRVWEVKPPGSFEDQWFRVFCGDFTRKPRILLDDEEMPPEDDHLIVSVPKVEYLADFKRNILDAIREIAGMATMAMNPFIADTEAVAYGFGRTLSVLSREDCDFVSNSVRIYPERFKNPSFPRFAHVDLSLSGDSTGVAVGYVSRFVEINRNGHIEMMPEIVYDLVLEVKPPQDGEIVFSKIRALFYKLREVGLNLKWISFDTFQSSDSVQILAEQGFVTGKQSVDVDLRCYDFMKSAFYDRRILLPDHPKALSEIVRLERDPKTGKVDHPADASKDCSDAIAGVAFGLTMQREIWHLHSLESRIPSELLLAS